MAITIPDKTKVRPTINYKHIPCEAKVAMTNPGPVCVAASGSASSGAILVDLIDSAGDRKGYLGFNVMSDIPAGGAPSVLKDTIVEGFAGVEPQKRVFVANDGSLTHTPPTSAGPQAAAVDASIGTLSATGSHSVIVPAGTINKITIEVETTLAAHDTNYWTFSAVNKGAAGTGTTALLAATDANTTKATGGSGLTNFVARDLSLTGTAADLVTAEDDVVVFTATKASSASNLVGLRLRIEFEGGMVAEIGGIGTGVTTTKIYFD